MPGISFQTLLGPHFNYYLHVHKGDPIEKWGVRITTFTLITYFDFFSP